MSAEISLTTRTIYVELLDEGTFVMRPVKGRRVRGNTFQILTSRDYDSELETWQFVPGTVVECEEKHHQGNKILVATRALATGQAVSETE